MNVCPTHAVVYGSSTCPACEIEARYNALRDTLSALMAQLPTTPATASVVDAQSVNTAESSHKKIECDSRDERAALAILGSSKQLAALREFLSNTGRFNVSELKEALGMNPSVKSRSLAPALRVLGCVETSVGGVWTVTPEARRKITTYPHMF